MKKSSILFFASLIISSTLLADTTTNTDANEVKLEDNESSPTTSAELDAVKAWIAAKRTVTTREKAGNLLLSGDVRTEYATANENKNGAKNIGPNSLHPEISNDIFKVKFNFFLDYMAEKSWSSIKLKFDNKMGIISGTNNRIVLERAFFGLRVVDADEYTIDLELGRRNLFYVFDSRIQFASPMDGPLIKYSESYENIGDIYVFGGPFLVNDTNDQFAYVAECGIYNIGSTGLYSKYSIIDWNTKNFADNAQQSRFEFLNHQITCGYRFTAPKINKSATVYGAFLINSAAKHHEAINNKIKNKGAYVGFNVGLLRKKGDFAFDTNVQYVEAQAVPDFDSIGIGIGNADNAGLYTTNINGTGAPTTNANAVGSGNFIGWQYEFQYLFTEHLTVSQSLKISKSLHDLQTQYSYKQYKIEFIYAW